MPKKIPLHLVLAVQFAVQAIGIASLVGYLSYRSGQHAVEDLAHQLMAETSDRIALRLDKFLNQASRINQIHIATWEAQAIGPQRLDLLHRYLIRQLPQFPEVATVLFGTPEGEFRLVHRVSPQEFADGVTRLDPEDLPYEVGISDPDDPSQMRVYSIDEEGDLVEQVETTQNIDVRDRPWYQLAAEKRQPVWSLPLQIGASNLLGLNAYAPVFDEEQQLQGVFSVNVSLDILDRFLESARLGETGQVFVLERSGLLVATSSGKRPYTTSVGAYSSDATVPGGEFQRLAARDSSHPLIRAAGRAIAADITTGFGSGEPQSLSFDLDGDRHWLSIVPYGNECGLDWAIVAVVPQAEFTGEIRANVRRTVWLCGLVAIASVGGSIWTSRRLTRSLSRLAAAVRQFAQTHQWTRSLPPSRIREVSALAEDFQQMANSLHRAEELHQNYERNLEQQVAEQTAALYQSAARLQLITDSIYGCIAYTDAEQRYQFVNKTYEDWFGCAREEIIGRTVEEVIGTEAYRRTRDYIERALSGETVNYATELPYKGGQTRKELSPGVSPDVHTPRYVSEVLVPDIDAQNQVRGYYALITDISDRKQLELALHESQTQLSEVLDTAIAGIIRLRLYPDASMQYDYISPYCERYFGYPVEELMPDASLWRSRILPEDWEQVVWPNLQAILARCTTSIRTMEYRFRRRDGSICWILANCFAQWNEAGQCWSVTVVDTDITERKQTAAVIQASETLFRALFEQSVQGIAFCRTDTEIPRPDRINRRMCELLGYSEAELMAMTFRDITHPDDLAMAADYVTKLLRGELNNYSIECRYVRKDGSLFWGETTVSLVQNLPGQPDFKVVLIEDVSDRKQAQAQMVHNALHDPLTDLPNRKLLLERLELAIARARRLEDFRYAVLFIDLDRFKAINDSLGHAIGDRLLIAVARRLQGRVQSIDLVARVGGDEFAILLEDVGEPNDVLQLAEQILGECRVPIAIDGSEVFASMSIGIVLGNPDYRQATTVLRDADIAMYRAKARQSNSYQFFDADMRDRILAQLALERELRRAIDNEELTLYYQPIVDLRSDRLAGFEALVRWQHPTRGLVHPGDFIPIAEETGLIVPLDRWVFYNACQQIATWRQVFPNSRALKISINLSARELRQADALSAIDSILDELGLAGSAIAIEITERMLVENIERTSTLLAQLAAREIQVGIDDFGTGYSSLNYLYRLPIHSLKIDRSFVSQMHLQNRNYQVVSTIVALGDRLGLKVIAEGIETSQQRRHLQELGCRFGQGNLFSRPLSATDVEQYFF